MAFAAAPLELAVYVHFLILLCQLLTSEVKRLKLASNEHLPEVPIHFG